ncbi:hypothetical protein Tco_1519346, partial [Tanacetum coccineum]
KKVKKLEAILKRRHVVLTDSKDEEPEDQGRKFQDIDDDPLGSKGDFVTPTKPSGEAQKEEISPTTLEAAKTLSKVASQRSRSVDKGKRYKRRKESKGKDFSTGFEKVSTAQHYTEEDWDAIRAKLEANAELTKNVIGKELPEERAKARRSKPMTQSLLRNYMMNYLKNQGTWKLTQLKKLSFEEVKEEFDKLVKQVEYFRIDVSDTKEKGGKVKEEEPVKRVGKRNKQKARKGISIDKSPQGDSETDKEESVEAMNPTPLDTKSNIVANWMIFQQGERSIYQIIRANRIDTVYMSFGAMLKDFTREDLIEMYKLVMQKDAIWSLPLQQKMISWRYYDKCAVHCLTLEACNIYMLADKKYPLLKDVCQVMLKMKLLDGKMNEVCYKLLKMIEKQAGVKK